MVEINPQFLDSLTYAAKADRQILRDFITEGILTSTALQVTESDTPAMSVKVAAGVAFVQNDSGTDRGHYRIYNDAAVTKTIAASDPSNPRKDRVIAQVYDAIDIGGSDNKWQIEVLTGTPAASPVAPALPNNALDLAIIDVAAGATTVTNANITDQRTLSTFSNFISQLAQLTGAQNIGGVKTFLAFPVTPSSAPTNNYEVSNKKYVDDEIDKEGLYITTITSSATPTPARASKRNLFTITALAEAATIGEPTGTPADGDTLLIRFKDDATARALSWNAIYRAGADVPLPTTTVLSKTLYVGFVYNSTDTKWDCILVVDNI